LPEPARGAPRRILVINVCRIGDTLLATPAIRALAAAHRAAEITVLGHPKRIEVLEHLPFIARAAGISKLSARLRARLGGPRWDLALVYGFDAPLVSYALRAARRVVAFRQDDEALNRGLYRAVERPAFQAAHSVHLALRLTDALGIPHAGYRLAYRVTEAEAAWAQARLGAGIGPRIGLQLASFPTKAYRDWPLESFIALAREIRQHRPSSEFLVFGGTEDRGRAAELARALGTGCTVLAGTLTLRQTAALMSRTQLYIGVDTGPTHLMSCFDIPLIALYHCYSPSRLIGALEHPRYTAIDHPRPYPCSIDTPMSEIGVETVLAATERALG
jgi:heptosyltransferase-3